LDLTRRKRDHERLLLKGTHKNHHLQNAFNKYGKDSYKFGIIAICEKDKDFLLDLEQKLIDSYNWNDLFNFNKFTRVTTIKFDIDHNCIKNVIKDTADGVPRKEIIKKYKLSNLEHHRRIVTRQSYGFVNIDKEIVEKAQSTLRDCIRYTESELIYIRQNYKKGLSFLAKKLNRREQTLQCQISRMGLDRGLLLNKKEVCKIIKLFSKNYTIDELAKKFKCHKRTVYRIILERDLSKYNIDQTVIDLARSKIKTKEI
jgi:hypothetical protein